jgi:hypothetical protein
MNHAVLIDVRRGTRVSSPGPSVQKRVLPGLTLVGPSVPSISSNEVQRAMSFHIDGGRAVVADEAIAWATFCHARVHDWLPDGQPAVFFDRVAEMTYGLEVATRTRSQWRHALSTGLDCMLALWQHPPHHAEWPLTWGTR